MEIKVNDKIYSVEVAETQEEKEKGLSNRRELKENEGMLFVYDEPQHLSFWMKDTEIPLDIIFISEDLEVISVHQGKPMSEDLIEEDDAMYVLEVNIDSGIKSKDEVEFEDEEIEKLPTMKVLAPDGSTQMELVGGERIVSRRETLVLIKNAKKAYKSQDDKDYKRLGKYMFKVLKGQDSREPEYVTLPDKKE